MKSLLLLTFILNTSLLHHLWNWLTLLCPFVLFNSDCMTHIINFEWVVTICVALWEFLTVLFIYLFIYLFSRRRSHSFKDLEEFWTYLVLDFVPRLSTDISILVLVPKRKEPGASVKCRCFLWKVNSQSPETERKRE